MFEKHRVIRQSLNRAEWDLVRAFVRKLDRNDNFSISGSESEKLYGRQTNTVRSQVSCTAFVYPRRRPTDCAGRSVRLEGERDWRILAAGRAGAIREMPPQEVSSSVLCENTAMLRLVKKLGFVPRALSPLTAEFKFTLGQR